MLTLYCVMGEQLILRESLINLIQNTLRYSRNGAY